MSETRLPATFADLRDLLLSQQAQIEALQTEVQRLRMGQHECLPVSSSWSSAGSGRNRRAFLKGLAGTTSLLAVMSLAGQSQAAASSETGLRGNALSVTDFNGSSNDSIGVSRGGTGTFYLAPAPSYTKSGAPASGSHNVGEFYVDKDGSLYYCTASGTPGSWTKLATHHQKYVELGKPL